MLKKALITFLALSMLVFVLFLAGWEKNEPHILPLKPAVPYQEIVKPVWISQESFSGQAPGQTKVFKVPRGPWRLRWEIDGNPNSGSLSLTVLSQDKTRPPIAEKIGLRAPGDGDVIIHETGAFHVLVSSFEANWKLTIDWRD